MCDCYYHKCFGCGKELPIHLGDYKTKRDEINVYCADCMPPIGSRRGQEYIVIERIFIESLTDNAWKHKYINHPNRADWFVSYSIEYTGETEEE